jgi:hypothetical protein
MAYKTKRAARNYVREWRVKHPRLTKRNQRNANTRRSHGISFDEKQTRIKKQKNRCAACRAKKPGCRQGWSTDHCHKTGKLRGELCHGCNLTLGHIQDSTKRLIALICYLRKYKLSKEN